MPIVDLSSIEETNRTGYPPPYDADVAGRWYRRLAPATGLTDFGGRADDHDRGRSGAGRE